MFNFDTIKFSLSGETGSVYMTPEKDHNKWDENGNSLARYVSFLFLKDEWVDFQNCIWSGTFHDIGHRLDVFGDYCLYYDIELPRNISGTMTIKYQKFLFPVHVRKIVARYLRYNLYLHQKYSPDYSKNNDKVYLVCSPERFKLLCRRYGQGKGTVKVEMTSETKGRLVEAIRQENKVKNTKVYCSKKDGTLYPVRDNSPRLSLCVLGGLVRSAKNTTNKFSDKSILYLHADPRDEKYYGFYYVDPNGRRVSNGAIVNHGTNDKPDWSYHT